MTNTRYGFSFIISAVVYTLLGISILSLANVPKVLKKPEEQSIKVSIITPIVKKVIEPVKIPTPPVIIPPKKIKPKKIIKKKIVKKIKPKKIVKKKKVVKKVKPKKIIKKKVIKKVNPIKRKVEPQPIIEPEPIYTSSIVPDEIYTHSSIVDDTPPPVIYNEPKLEPTVVTTPTYSAPVEPMVIQEPVIQAVAPQQTNNNEAKKAFLNNLRGKIIANKEYPKIALRRHIEGAVKVRFDLTASGDVSNIRFLEGKTILQKGVRKAILKSFPINIPFELQNDLPMYNISVTVNFNIR